MTDCLNRLKEGIGSYVIKVNHRLLLDGMMLAAGVPPVLFRPICSAIDKLDKMPWEAVKEECCQKVLG